MQDLDPPALPSHGSPRAMTSSTSHRLRQGRSMVDPWPNGQNPMLQLNASIGFFSPSWWWLKTPAHIIWMWVMMTLLDFGQTMRNMQSSLSLPHCHPRIKVCNECHSNLTNTAPHSSMTPQVLESINRPMTWQVLKTCTALQMPHRAVFWANLSTRTWRSNLTGRNRRCQLCLWLACAFLAFQCSEILSKSRPFSTHVEDPNQNWKLLKSKP